jgi:hypothetical protein
MLRSIKSKLIIPVAGLSLVLGMGVVSRADDMTPPATTMPAGKASIVVTVVDGDGKAVDGATVTYKISTGKKGGAAKLADDPAVTPVPVKTDADGKATLKDVPDGTYSVSARLKGTGNGKSKVVIADGKDATVTITLKPKAAK